MDRGFHIGKILGINISLDISWIFIFLLVTGTLVFSVFPALHPEWGFFLSAAVGVIASVLFFASVLTHEIAHSLVARSRGIPVRNITLFLFGGVSDIEREPPSPGVEFAIAVVGPLTSIGLGFLFLLLGSLIAGGMSNIVGAPAQTLSKLGPVATLLLWLGPVNILVGLFNLIPGFPLDGGRILRSLIWRITNNFRQATHIAALTGQAVGWGFVAIGILMIFGIRFPILGGGLIGGLWLAFIGWFLSSIAGQSYQQAIAEDTLKNVKVSQVMQTDILTVPAKIPISQLVDNYIVKKRERVFPVITNSHLQGLVTLEDVRKIPRKEWNKNKVYQIMTPVEKLWIVSPDENVNNALNILARHDVNQLPVIRDGKLLGLLSRRDILLWLWLYASNNQE